MVFRTTGASWLTLMMRAERAQRCWEPSGSEWLLYGPTDPEVVQEQDQEQHQEQGEDDAPPTLLAAE